MNLAASKEFLDDVHTKLFNLAERSSWYERDSRERGRYLSTSKAIEGEY